MGNKASKAAYRDIREIGSGAFGVVTLCEKMEDDQTTPKKQFAKKRIGKIMKITDIEFIVANTRYFY